MSFSRERHERIYLELLCLKLFSCTARPGVPTYNFHFLLYNDHDDFLSLHG